MIKNKKFSEEPLKDFYAAIADDDPRALMELHIPHSSVFMAREAYFHYSGEWVSLQRMEAAMKLEGMLPND